MKRFWAMAAGFAVLAGAAAAETKVEIKGVHLCCGACVKGVAAALKDVDGVTPKCDQKAKTITLTATDEAAAQKALDALATAGYHGDTGSKTLVIKEEKAPDGKVKSLSLSGVHNCCGACCKAIKAAVKTVDGVSGDTAKPKNGTFKVTGDFDAAAVLKALNSAGFHVKVEE
jgi:mercuric ion binding protein